MRYTKTVIESIEGEERLSQEVATNSITMAEADEAIREMGRVMMENLSTQLEVQREREATNIERFRELIEEQNRCHRDDTEILASEFERMRIEKEQARGRQNQRLPNYDGINLDVDEWQDKVEAVMTCNGWDISRLLEALPTSLTAQAKRAFDSVTEDNKRTKELLFQSMRVKIDPQSERKNKEMFLAARKAPNENVMSYIDRCKMYIRRSGSDPNKPFAQEMLRYKVYDSMTLTDKKILNATVGPDETLKSIIMRADSMMGTPSGVIGGVMGQELAQDKIMNQGWYDTSNFGGNNYYDNVRQGSNVPRQQIICYGCGRPGHLRRTCRNTMEEEHFNQYRGQEHQSKNHLANQSSPQIRETNTEFHQRYQAMWGPVNMGEGNGISMQEPRSAPGLNGDHERFETRERAQTRESRETDRQAEGNQEPTSTPTNP